jgi:pimeloyl-ACP methyl ester carboxylesterase
MPLVFVDLSKITAPVLVVRGGLDRPDVERAAAKLVRELLDAREVVIEGIAHLPALEEPDKLAQAILDFLP